MGLAELIEQILHQLHPFESISSTLLFIGFVLCTFVQISPIKIKIGPFPALLLIKIGKRNETILLNSLMKE